MSVSELRSTSTKKIHLTVLPGLNEFLHLSLSCSILPLRLSSFGDHQNKQILMRTTWDVFHTHPHQIRLWLPTCAKNYWTIFLARASRFLVLTSLASGRLFPLLWVHDSLSKIQTHSSTKAKCGRLKRTTKGVKPKAPLEALPRHLYEWKLKVQPPCHLSIVAERPLPLSLAAHGPTPGMATLGLHRGKAVGTHSVSLWTRRLCHFLHHLDQCIRQSHSRNWIFSPRAQVMLG